MREQEVQKKLEKENGQAWKDNRVVYIEEKFSGIYYRMKSQSYSLKYHFAYHILSLCGFLKYLRFL